MLLDPNNSRYSNFLRFSKDDAAKAEDLFHWNARLSSSLLYHYGVVEVSLRQFVDRLMRTSDNNWLARVADTNAKNRPAAFRKKADTESLIVRNSLKLLRSNGGGHAPADTLVAAVGLSFWVQLFRPQYEQSLWTPIFSRHFTNKKRADVCERLFELLRVRNALVHNEVIIFHGHALKPFSELIQLKRQVVQVVAWFDGRTAERLNHWCEYEQILDEYFIHDNRPIASLQIASVTKRGVALHLPSAGLIFCRKDKRRDVSLMWGRFREGGTAICVIDHSAGRPAIKEILDVQDARPNSVERPAQMSNNSGATK